MKNYSFCVGLLLLLGIIGVNGQGTILWDESINGPLSNDGTHPTWLGTLQTRTNSVFGATEYISFGTGGALYGDYFTFAIPQSLRVGGLNLTVDRAVLVWVGDQNFSQELSHVYNPANGSLLPQMGLPFLAAGTYGMYITVNDFSGSGTANYRLDFVMEAVPEPSAGCLLLMGAGVVGVLGWKKGR